MSELARRAVRGTLAAGLSNVVTRVVAFATGLYLMATVDARAFGLVDYAVALLAILGSAGNFGFAQAAIHRRERVAETFATFLLLRVGLLVAVLMLLPVAALAAPGLIVGRTHAGALAVLAGAQVLEGAAEAMAARLSRDLRFARLMVADIAGVAVGAAAGITLAALDFGLWALVVYRASHVAARAVGLAVVGVEPVRLRFHREDAAWLLRFGFPLWLGGLATTWVLKYDDLVVGWLTDAKTLGHYGRAYAFALVPVAVVTGVLTRVSFPLYARLQGDRPRLSEAFRLVSGTTLRLAAPTAVAIAVALPDLLAVLGWTARWGPMVPLYRWLLVYTLVRPLLDDAGGLLTAVGRPRVTGRTLLAQAAALVVLCPVLTRWRGAEGAALSVGVVVLAALGIYYVAFLRRLVDVPWRRMVAWPLLSLAVASAAAIGVGAAGWRQPGWAPGLAKLTALAVVYAGGMLLLDGRGLLGDLRTLRRHALATEEDRG
jgi:O-antigen/teichoic acid export membrane protein